MATVATVTPELSVKSENVIYQRWSKVIMKQDQPTVIDDVKVAIVSNPSEDETKKLTEDGYTLEFSQTVRVDKAGNDAGQRTIVTDEEERTNVFNRGLASKLNQKLNAKFKETKEDGTAEFQSTEDVFDPSELVNEATKRVILSPTEKAMKGLEKAGLAPDVLAAVIASLQAAQAGS
jgi:hypothetical protein